MKRRGLTPEGQTLEGLVSNAEKSQEEFHKAEASKVVVSLAGVGLSSGFRRGSGREAFAELGRSGVVGEGSVLCRIDRAMCDRALCRGLRLLARSPQPSRGPPGSFGVAGGVLEESQSISLSNGGHASDDGRDRD